MSDILDKFKTLWMDVPIQVGVTVYTTEEKRIVRSGLDAWQENDSQHRRLIPTGRVQYAIGDDSKTVVVRHEYFLPA